MLTTRDKQSQQFQSPLPLMYVGTVIENQDPEHLGRLKIMIPEVYEGIDKESLPWANPVMGFGGGGDYGMFYIPPKEAKVHVMFFRGHQEHPLWFGTHWFREEAPTEAQLMDPQNFVLKTPEGHLFDMHDGKPYIRLKDMRGNFVILNGQKDNLEISVNNDMLLRTTANSDETVGQGKRLRVGTRYSLDVSGPIHIRASGPIYLDGTQIHLNSGSSAPQAPMTPKDVDHRMS